MRRASIGYPTPAPGRMCRATSSGTAPPWRITRPVWTGPPSRPRWPSAWPSTPGGPGVGLWEASRSCVTVVLGPRFVVDVLEREGHEPHLLGLPLHLAGTVE